MRYFIEQAQDRFYNKADLATAKARARRMSLKADSGVYVIAEQYNPDLLDYEQCGSIAFFDGFQDAKEGCFA
jgi:hypothetical protein